MLVSAAEASSASLHGLNTKLEAMQEKLAVIQRLELCRALAKMPPDRFKFVCGL